MVRMADSRGPEATGPTGNRRSLPTHHTTDVLCICSTAAAVCESIHGLFAGDPRSEAVTGRDGRQYLQSLCRLQYEEPSRFG